MVICLERGADLQMALLMPLPLTVSCFSKIQIGFTFLVPAHPGSPGQRAVKWVCVLTKVGSCKTFWSPLVATLCYWDQQNIMTALAILSDKAQTYNSTLNITTQAMAALNKICFAFCASRWQNTKPFQLPWTTTSATNMNLTNIQCIIHVSTERSHDKHVERCYQNRQIGLCHIATTQSV